MYINLLILKWKQIYTAQASSVNCFGSKKQSQDKRH